MRSGKKGKEHFANRGHGLEVRVGGEDLLNKGSQWSKNHGEGNDPKL